MKKTWNIKPFIGLFIWCIYGIAYLVYTNMPKTFYVDDLEVFWNEFREHPNFSDFKYRKSTIIFRGDVSYIETSEKDDFCYICFYFQKDDDFKEDYKNMIAVTMNIENINFKENDKVNLKAEYEFCNSTREKTNIYLKNGEIIE